MLQHPLVYGHDIACYFMSHVFPSICSCQVWVSWGETVVPSTGPWEDKTEEADGRESDIPCQSVFIAACSHGHAILSIWVFIDSVCISQVHDNFVSSLLFSLRFQIPLVMKALKMMKHLKLKVSLQLYGHVFWVWFCIHLDYSRYTRENSFWKTLFQVGMDLKKVQKQGRDKRIQEYLTSAKIHSRCRVVFLHSFLYITPTHVTTITCAHEGACHT